MKRQLKPLGIKATAPAEISEETASRTSAGLFPIAGIGASAGGLEALEQFLGGVPASSGMAFVVVQHLDPTHKGILPELLQRATTLPVQQVKDRMKVQPDCVYVIPPNKDMSILHGVLHLLDPVAPRGLRLPIDFFLRSLAQDRQERSIGVILSGMGTDGTLGLRAIKEKAGLALVQEPASAKFDAMPRSAIDAGLADIVAPPRELPEKIIAFLKHTPMVAARCGGSAGEPDPERFGESRPYSCACAPATTFLTIRRAPCIAGWSGAWASTGSTSIAGYVRYLQENPRNWIFSSESC